MNFEEQLAICEAATPGPWGVIDWGGHPRITCNECDVANVLYGPGQDEDAAFMAAARQGYPEALRRLVRLRELMGDFIQKYPLPKIDDEVRELLEIP